MIMNHINVYIDIDFGKHLFNVFIWGHFHGYLAVDGVRFLPMWHRDAPEKEQIKKIKLEKREQQFFFPTQQGLTAQTLNFKSSSGNPLTLGVPRSRKLTSRGVKLT